MRGTSGTLRHHLLRGAAGIAIALSLGATDAAGQPSPTHGRCANAAGNIDDAIAACSFLIRSGREHGRNLAISHYNRGLWLARKGELDRAIADFSQAIRIRPDYARAHNARGSAFGRKNDLDRAMADFNRAIELDPNFAAAFNNRGITFAKKGDDDRAIADAGAAIRLDPSHARAYGTRGSAYACKGEMAWRIG